MFFLRVSACLFSLSVCTSASFSQGLSKPDDNRFTKLVLAQKLEEPMQFEILNDGRVVFAERKGKLKVYEPLTGKVKIVAEIPVSTKYVSKEGVVTEAEDGFQGLILDPKYDENHWIYLYYSQSGTDHKNILVRYEWYGNELIAASKKVILEVPVQREECCHVGGGMLFDKHNNLLLSTGDNTFSRASDGFTPIDERPGQSPRDAQKSSGNTNDLRGKILRIHPEPDGTYTVPEENLFAKGTPLTRPEIYTMGNRNPWRLTIDSKTGWLYWGEVGPDGSVDGEYRGPRSYDEFNVAKKAGNYGWPYFLADNKAYWDYDFATARPKAKFNPDKPVNDSPNNTGLADLPPAQPAMIWYPYDASAEFPELGSGGHSATGGPIFHRADFKGATKLYPQYYEGKWFITDWVRGWIMAVSLDEDGNYKSLEPFLPDLHLKGPIDMDFGPDGSLYVLEYGNGYFTDNPEAQLIKIEYNAGNRSPIVQAAANKTAGSIPFQVKLSSEGTRDYDADRLTYQWRITGKGITPKIYSQPNPVITLSSAGVKTATLTVTDTKGAKSSKSVLLRAGNEPPKIRFNISSGNKSFYFPGSTLTYTVQVNDKEDGSLADKRIKPANIMVSIDYLTDGFDITQLAQSQKSVNASVKFLSAVSLMDKSDCKTCHAAKTISLGPSFTAVAKKYKGQPDVTDRLAKKVISGGTGVWGDAIMPAHTSLSESDAKSMVNYILSLDTDVKSVKSFPIQGSYTTNIPAADRGRGSFVLRAAYTDRGTQSARPQTAQDVVVLRNPLFQIAQADKFNGVEFDPKRGVAIIKSPASSILLRQIDLTAIKQLELVSRGGSIHNNFHVEIRLDSVNGILAGSASESKININSIAAGIYDVYVVFNQNLTNTSPAPVELRAIRFIN